MKPRGISLLELLVTLAIVAVLAAIALPGYGAIMRRALRNDARLALLGIAHDEELHFQAVDAYTDQLTLARELGGLGLAASSSAGDYQLAIELRASGQGFLATARPAAHGRQATDDSCAVLSIDESGLRAATNRQGLDTSGTCWR